MRLIRCCAGSRAAPCVRTRFPRFNSCARCESGTYASIPRSSIARTFSCVKIRCPRSLVPAARHTPAPLVPPSAPATRCPPPPGSPAAPRSIILAHRHRPRVPQHVSLPLSQKSAVLILRDRFFIPDFFSRSSRFGISPSFFSSCFSASPATSVPAPSFGSSASHCRCQRRICFRIFARSPRSFSSVSTVRRRVRRNSRLIHGHMPQLPHPQTPRQFHHLREHLVHPALLPPPKSFSAQ